MNRYDMMGNWHLNDKYVGTLTNPGTIALPRQYIHSMHLNESLRSKVCTLNDKNEICMHMSDRIKHVGTRTTALDGGGCLLIDYTYREISCFGTLVPLFWLTLYVDKRWPKTAQLMVSKSHDDEVLSFPPPVTW